MTKAFLYSIFAFQIFTFSAFSQTSTLPRCQGEYSAQTWTDCYGSRKILNGDSYSGEYKYGKAHGSGTYLNADGTKYIGQYQMGKRSGKGTEYTVSGLVNKEGEWDNGEFINKNMQTKSDNYRKQIINHSVCINKLIYHEKLFVQKLMDQARLTGNDQMKSAARAQCGYDALAYLYYHNEISKLQSQHNISSNELSLLFKEAQKISYAQLLERSGSKDNSLTPEILSELKRPCSMENIESSKMANILKNLVKIDNGEASGPTVEQICSRQIPGLF
jgi:hypothetical protein